MALLKIENEIIFFDCPACPVNEDGMNRIREIPISEMTAYGGKDCIKLMTPVCECGAVSYVTPSVEEKQESEAHHVRRALAARVLENDNQIIKGDRPEKVSVADRNSFVAKMEKCYKAGDERKNHLRVLPTKLDGRKKENKIPEASDEE